MPVIQSQDRPGPAAPDSGGGLRSPLVTIDLSASFKAYDVRGIVGESITAETVRATGAAFVDVLGLAGLTVLVGGDMRPSSPEFVDAFAEGAVRRGADVVKIGLISTDELYYASGTFGAAAVVGMSLGGMTTIAQKPPDRVVADYWLFVPADPLHEAVPRCGPRSAAPAPGRG